MYNYKIKEVIRVYDGDTVTVVVDQGFYNTKQIKVRLGRINTPEIRTRDLEEKKRGYIARDYLRSVIEDNKDNLTITSTGKGKYGRWIGELFYGKTNINDELVSLGYAEYRDY